jgi:hypothetical protein
VKEYQLEVLKEVIYISTWLLIVFMFTECSVSIVETVHEAEKCRHRGSEP